MLHFPELKERLRKKKLIAIMWTLLYLAVATALVFPFLSPFDGENQVRLTIFELAWLAIFAFFCSKRKLYHAFRRTITGKVTKLNAKDDDLFESLARLMDVVALDRIREKLDKQIGVLIVQEEHKRLVTAITVPSIKHLDLYENGDTVWISGDMQMPIILNRLPDMLPCPLCATVFPIAHSLTCPICSLRAEKE